MPVMPPAASRAARLWGDLRDALRGGERDYTVGSLHRAVGLLAVPMILEMALESVFAVVDVFFVARLGAAAVATVGLTEAVLILVFAVAIGLGTATTALVARRIGEHDPDAAALTAVQALLVGLALAGVLGVAGWIGAPTLLAWMGATPEVIATGVRYTQVILGGAGSVLLLFLGNAVFRAAGDAAIAMRVLWLANVLNLVLDPCLIFGLGPFPALGVTGAAVATVVGRSCGVVFLLWTLARGRGRVAIGRRHLRLDPGALGRLLRVSVGGILQYLVETASWLGLVRLLALFGEAALAGYTIGIRIVGFTFLPSWGLSNAAATLVGQSLGAGRPERAEAATWLTARYNFLYLISVGAVFLVVPGPLVGRFTADPAVAAVAVECLRWIGACYGFFAYGLVTMQAFNGAGDTTTPTLAKLFTYWVWQIPVAWLLAHPAGIGPRGVFLAVASAEVLMCAIGVSLFRRGRWKLRQI